MNTPFSVDTLARENRQFRHTAGVSQGCRSRHFVPAFYDAATGRSYPSRFADGRPAPLHLLDGLPENLVLKRDRSGAVKAVRHTIIAGFLRDGQFYTRDQAAAAAEQTAAGVCGFGL